MDLSIRISTHFRPLQLAEGVALAVALASAAVLFGELPASAAPIDFVRVVDTNTTIPGTSGTFNLFGGPTISNTSSDVIGFEGAGSTTNGVYRSDAGVTTTIVDSNDQIPGGTHKFAVHGAGPWIDGPDSVFAGRDRVVGPTDAGIFAVTNGTLSAVVLATDTTPAGSPYIGFVDRPSLDGGLVVFGATSGSPGNPDPGIYGATAGQPNSVFLVADEGTDIPDGSGNKYLEFSLRPVGADNTIAFRGLGPMSDGVYTYDVPSAELSIVADTATPVPDAYGSDGMDTFAAFGQATTDAGDVVFIASAPTGGPGIYAKIDGTLRLVVDTNTKVPGGVPTTTFLNLDSGLFAIDDGEVLFLANDTSGGRAAYLYRNRKIARVLGVGDFLDGEFVLDMVVRPGGLRESTAAVRVTFASSTAIYLVTVPNPEPDIVVSPFSLDFGDVELPGSNALMVSISNVGALDLEVMNIDFQMGSSGAFASTSVPSPVVVLAPGASADVGITFTPTTLGVFSGTLEIGSDDPDESLVVVDLVGTGVVSDDPPSQQIMDILNFIDDSVAAGTLEGSGPGSSGTGRLNALKNQIEAAGDLFGDGLVAEGCDQLLDALERTDGEFPPPDFVEGHVAAELELLIEILLDQECS